MKFPIQSIENTIIIGYNSLPFIIMGAERKLLRIAAGGMVIFGGLIGSAKLAGQRHQSESIENYTSSHSPNEQLSYGETLELVYGKLSKMDLDGSNHFDDVSVNFSDGSLIANGQYYPQGPSGPFAPTTKEEIIEKIFHDWNKLTNLRIGSSYKIEAPGNVVNTKVKESSFDERTTINCELRTGISLQRGTTLTFYIDETGMCQDTSNYLNMITSIKSSSYTSGSLPPYSNVHYSGTKSFQVEADLQSSDLQNYEDVFNSIEELINKR